MQQKEDSLKSELYRYPVMPLAAQHKHIHQLH